MKWIWHDDEIDEQTLRWIETEEKEKHKAQSINKITNQ